MIFIIDLLLYLTIHISCKILCKTFLHAREASMIAFVCVIVICHSESLALWFLFKSDFIQNSLPQMLRKACCVFKMDGQGYCSVTASGKKDNHNSVLVAYNTLPCTFLQLCNI